MTDEFLAIFSLLKPNNTPLEVLQLIVNSNNFVPNVAVALNFFNNVCIGCIRSKNIFKIENN